MPPAPKNAPYRNRPFSFLLFLALGAALFMVVMGPKDWVFSSKKPVEISLSEFVQKYNAGDFETVEVDEQTLNAKTEDGKIFVSTKEPSANIVDLGFDQSEIPTAISVKDNSSGNLWRSILLNVLPFVLFIALIVFLMRRANSSMGMGEGGGPFGFGKSRAKIYKKDKNGIKFAAVAGSEEAKEDVMEVVDFLKNPKKYKQAGAKVPKGLLLVGPPGTGKTLLARAIAGEASVPFYSVSGSEFVEMFAGVGASRVRDLFNSAKKSAPSIIFIDEIDAIGKHRGQGYSGGHDEREQTLNQILTEMDGFENDTSVIVIAATNRPDVLDKALLRPGRFDRRIVVDLPDMNAREKILKLHAQNKKLDKSVQLKKVASKTVGFSGADLENVMNEAAIFAVKNKRKTINAIDIDDSVEKVSLGVARKSRKITDKEKKIVAYHEVGHALAGHFAGECEPVHKISIVSRGGALGVTWFLPEEDTYLRSEKRLKDEMVSLHGGRMAEQIIFGETTTGASNDLERITDIARSMVMTYGMGDKRTLGPVVFRGKKGSIPMGDDHDEYSEETARLIDKEVQALVQEAEDRCIAILKKHKILLEKISQDLLKKENVSREEFLEYLKEIS